MTKWNIDDYLTINQKKWLKYTIDKVILSIIDDYSLSIWLAFHEIRDGISPSKVRRKFDLERIRIIADNITLEYEIPLAEIVPAVRIKILEEEPEIYQKAYSEGFVDYLNKRVRERLIFFAETYDHYETEMQLIESTFLIRLERSMRL